MPWYFALTRPLVILLPVAATVGATALLIYARLLGRLAWILSGLTGTRPRRRKKKLTHSQPLTVKEAPPAARSTSEHVTGYSLADDPEEKDEPQMASASEMLAPLQAAGGSGDGATGEEGAGPLPPRRRLHFPVV